MAKQSQAGVPPSETGNPDTFRYDQMQVMSALLEIQKDIAMQSTKVERLLSDREKDARESSENFGAVQRSLADIQNALTRNTALVVGGFAVGCVALFIIWFLVGDDVKALIEFARTLPRLST